MDNLFDSQDNIKTNRTEEEEDVLFEVLKYDPGFNLSEKKNH
jgi:hypothetical protein